MDNIVDSNGVVLAGTLEPTGALPAVDAGLDTISR